MLKDILFYLKIDYQSPIYNDGKLKLIDTISRQKNADVLSDRMQDVISSLDSVSQTFIYYKYYEQLSNLEISHVLNIDLAELEVFEKRLLGRLSENESLKRLVKK